MIYIQEARELEQHIRKLDNKPILSLDIETTGLNPYLSEIRLLQLSDKQNTLLIDVRKVGKPATANYIKPFLEDETVIKAGHNLKFDTQFIKYHLDIHTERLYDSFIASMLIEAGISKPKGFHGLEQVGLRYADLKIEKTEQLSDWSVNELSESQLNYAAKDVEVLFPIREAQIDALKSFGLVRCAKLEFDAILPTAWLELCGFYLDFDQWLTVANDHSQQADSVALSIYKDLQPVLKQGALFDDAGINLDSTVQVQKYFRELGVPMPDSTKEFILLPLVEKYPIIGKLLKYREHSKAASTFGESYRKFISPLTGRVHADFRQIGAETGRYAVSNPNLNQIPADNAHRKCFRAESGNKLISADFSQEELRILADFSGDVKFKKLFRSEVDFHKGTAAQIFRIPVENVTKEQRDLAKRMNFLLNYGGGAKKFSQSAGILETEAQMIINSYFQTFGGVKRWQNYQKFKILETKYTRSVSGRLMRFEFDESDGRERSGAQRNSVNSPIQSSGADILKRSLRVFYNLAKEYGNNVKLVNIVHDEINIEVKDDLVDEVKSKLVGSMKQAWSEFIKDVDIKIDCKTSYEWSKD